MFVAASTECFPHLPLVDAIDKLNDLEYTATEIAIHEDGKQIKPSQVLESVDEAVALCRDTHRLDLAGFSVGITATGDEHYRQWEAICRLAKATKVVSLTVPSAELGTPFNEEVEHLRRLVDIATVEGALVSIKTQVGRLSEDPDTCVVICDNVKGLGVTLDISPFICGPHAGRNHEKLMKYVYNTHLRDTSKTARQVRVGQGEVEYSKLVNLLRLQKYNRALCINMQPLEELDHNSEMRKIRLLMESLL
ncbi:MAG: TIM barrel protein [Planctomycetota bacterium]